MPIRPTLAVLAALLPSLLPSPLISPARAEPFSYQGFLTDSDLPATGFYDFRVLTYPEAVPPVPPPDQPVPPLSSEFFEDVRVVSGVFTLDLDLPQAVIDSFQAGNPIYLDIAVRTGTIKGYTTLSPRSRIRPTPFAAFAAQPIPSLQTAFDKGSTINTLPGMRLSVLGTGESLFTVPFHLNRPGSDTTTSADISLVPGLQGGRITLRDLTETLVTISPDSDNTGGFLSISRGNAMSGFIVDGNADNTMSTKVSVIGTQSTTVIDGSKAGTASVVLPANAIDATEILNEPGVAGDRATPNLVLPHMGPLAIAASRAITTPAAGYILVTGSMETRITGAATGSAGDGLAARIDYGISTNGVSIANGLDYLYEFSAPPIDNPGPEDVYALGNTLSFTDIIEVNQATTITISAVARFTSANVPAPVCTLRDVNINLLYVPTSYGLIARNPNPSSSPDLPDEAHPTSTITLSTILAEHRAEIRRAQLAHEQEQRATRQRLAQVEAQLQTLLAKQDRAEQEQAPQAQQD